MDTMLKVQTSDTQVISSLPLYLDNGEVFIPWNDERQFPGIMIWADGYGGTVVADIRETDTGRRLFVTFGEPRGKTYPSLDRVDAVERVLFRPGTEVVRGSSVDFHEGKLLPLVTMEEVKQCERTGAIRRHHVPGFGAARLRAS
jgi:hypothetical protein